MRRVRLLLFSMLALVAPAGPLRAAGEYSLIGHVDPSFAINYSDVWGWQHPVTGRAYALVGNNASALHIVDVTDPTNPFQASQIATVPRYEMKTWQHYVYTVDGLTGAGKIVSLWDPLEPEEVGTFPGGHTLWIDDEGYLYVSLPGLKVYDLNADPTAPEFVWEVPGTDGHDCVVVDDVLYEFRGFVGTFIWDVSVRDAPVQLGAILDPAIQYHHHGFPSEDGKFLFILDEYATHPTPDITVWNIESPAAAVKVGSIADPTSSAHNGYVVGNYLFVAYYAAGFKVFDVSNPAAPVLADFYDTSTYTGEGNFDGAWGCYPFGPGGTVYVSDRPNGLFVFGPDGPTHAGGTPDAGVTLRPGHPNPFTASVSVPFTLEREAEVTVNVFDARGRHVRVLRAGREHAGDHSVTWDGNDHAGREVPSGVYFVRLRAGATERVRKTVLVR